MNKHPFIPLVAINTASPELSQNLIIYLLIIIISHHSVLSEMIIADDKSFIVTMFAGAVMVFFSGLRVLLEIPAFMGWHWRAVVTCNKTINRSMLIFPQCLNQQRRVVAAQITTCVCFCFWFTAVEDVELWSDSSSSVWLLWNLLFTSSSMHMCACKCVLCVFCTNWQEQLSDCFFKAISINNWAGLPFLTGCMC